MHSIKHISVLLLICVCFMTLTGCEMFQGLFTQETPDDTKAEKNLMELSVMSFNMKFESIGSPSDPIHTWARRKGGIVECLNNYYADIVGTQELQCWQYKELMDLLGDSWAGVGEPRSGSNSERCSIIYNTETIEYLGGETIWLSETPTVSGSSSWGSAKPRILTYGKFLHKPTNTEFYFFNTHLDHLSSEARINQLQMVVSYMDKYIEKYPVILTGDFNVYLTNEAFDVLTSRTEDYANTFTPFLEELGENMKTSHGFNGGTSGTPIDYIFYSTSDLTVKSTQIIHDVYQNRYYLSDHYPVHSIFTFNE